MAKSFNLSKDTYEAILAMGVSERDINQAIIIAIKKRFDSKAILPQVSEKVNLIVGLIDGKQKRVVETFDPPTIEEITSFCNERGNNIDPIAFFNFYEQKNWKVGSTKMKDWKAAVITWERNQLQRKVGKYTVEEINSVSLNFAELIHYYQQMFPMFKNVSLTELTKVEFKCRILDGFKLENFKNAMFNVKNDDWARSKNFSYCNLDYFSREKTIRTYGNYLTQDSRQTQKIIVHD